MPIVIIVGPTAAGKSDFAVSLAEKTHGVIINGDMAQMYAPLTIGTAKPDWRNERVPHVLFDSIHEPRDSSASEFRKKTEQAIDDIMRSGKVPIVVGGSLFHIATLFFKLDETSRLPEYENKHENKWEELFRRDPKRALQIDPHDTYRIDRALALSQKKLPSECQPTFMPISDKCLLIHITRDREELYDRINLRVRAMLDNGWIDEVRSLDAAWHTWLLRKKIIGYDMVVQALASSQNPVNATLTPNDVATIQKKTRNYAKRQLTFWRSLKRRLHNESFHNIIECDLTLLPIDLYLEKISSLLVVKE